MAEARHKPPMQPWLAPVSNRLFGWTENGCEGTSPSAELRFQDSASPPSAAGRFPRRDTLPPRLPRARPPRPRPGPAPGRGPAPPRLASSWRAERPPSGVLQSGLRAAGRGGRFLRRLRGAGPRPSCSAGVSRGRDSGTLLRSMRAFFPRCFPGPLRSVISQASLPFFSPPSPT